MKNTKLSSYQAILYDKAVRACKKHPNKSVREAIEIEVGDTALSRLCIKRVRKLLDSV